MPQSLIELLPKVVSEGKKEVEKILKRQESDNKMLCRQMSMSCPARTEAGFLGAKLRP